MLQKINMPEITVAEVGKILTTVAALLSGDDVAVTLENLGITACPSQERSMTPHRVAQLLYSYLVHWLGMSSYCSYI